MKFFCVPYLLFLSEIAEGRIGYLIGQVGRRKLAQIHELALLCEKELHRQTNRANDLAALLSDANARITELEGKLSQIETLSKKDNP